MAVDSMPKLLCQIESGIDAIETVARCTQGLVFLDSRAFLNVHARTVARGGTTSNESFELKQCHEKLL